MVELLRELMPDPAVGDTHGTVALYEWKSAARDRGLLGSYHTQRFAEMSKKLEHRGVIVVQNGRVSLHRSE